MQGAALAPVIVVLLSKIAPSFFVSWLRIAPDTHQDQAAAKLQPLPLSSKSMQRMLGAVVIRRLTTINHPESSSG